MIQGKCQCVTASGTEDKIKTSKSIGVKWGTVMKPLRGDFLSNASYIPKLDTGDFRKRFSHSPILCF